MEVSDAHIAAEMGIFRATAHKWLCWFTAEGEPGLRDRPSLPHRASHLTASVIEARVCRPRTDREPGPARIGSIVDLPASIVYRSLTCHRLNRLSCRTTTPGSRASTSMSAIAGRVSGHWAAQPATPD